MNAPRDPRISKLEECVHELYERNGSVPFHGWHHISFVRAKAVEFAHQRGADPIIVECAALVHDLNYMVEKNSAPDAGRDLRFKYLEIAGFTPHEACRVEDLIRESHTANRTAKISLEGSALSDADTLFKALPITPVVLAPRYLAENNIDLRILAEKIVGEQSPLLENGIYFYDPAVSHRYLPWARANLDLWHKIMEALDDPDVVTLLNAMGAAPDSD